MHCVVERNWEDSYDKGIGMNPNQIAMMSEDELVSNNMYLDTSYMLVACG